MGAVTAVRSSDARGARLRAGRTVAGLATAMVAVLALTGAASAPAAPGVPVPVATRRAALPPSSLPASAPVRTSIDPVAFGPAGRDGSGAREARADGPLKLVAVTWAGPAPDQVVLRSTDAAGRWGTWTALDPAGTERDDMPAGRAEQGGTDPIWVGDRTAVQVRAVRGGVPVTDAVRVVRIDPGVGAEDAAIGRSGRGGPAAPAYVTRAQWGADESEMTWPPETTPTVRAVTVHHTAESNDYGPGDSAAIVRGIYAYHAKAQGWGDIGYNALVDKFGTIFEGRAGGLDKAVVGAHAGGFNRETFGVAMLGNLQDVPPTAPQLESVAALAAWKLGGLYRDPTQKITLTSAGGGTSRVPKGETATVPALFAHRDVGLTACPGDSAYARMDALRTRVRDLIAQTATDVRSAGAGGAGR